MQTGTGEPTTRQESNVVDTMAGAGTTHRPGFSARLLGFVSRRSGDAPPLDPTALRRLLLIRYDRIGDMIISTPILEAVRQIAPKCEIDVVASAGNASLLAEDPRVANVYIWPRSLLGRFRIVLACRRRHYDLTLQLILGKTTLPGLLAGMMTPHGITVGRMTPKSVGVLDIPVRAEPDNHYSEQTYALLRAGLRGIPPLDEKAGYRIILSERTREESDAILQRAGIDPSGGRFILLNVSASSAARRFDEKKQIALATRLKEIGEKRGLIVAVTGDPREADFITTIASGSATIPVLFPTILQAASAIGRASLVVSPDTSTVHTASAMRTPIVVYYDEHAKPREWGPRGVPHRDIVTPVQNVVEALEVDEVASAAEALLMELDISASEVGTVERWASSESVRPERNAT